MSASFHSNQAATEATMRKKLQAGTLTAAQDLLHVASATTPFKHGDLRTRQRAVATPRGAQAQWLVKYAAVQNRGYRAGTHFRNYTTPGTGAHFVERAIAIVKGRLPRYFK